MHRESLKLHDQTTVFQAELIAIQQGCNFILAHLDELEAKHVKILSDSQAAIQSLNKKTQTSKTSLETLESMESLAYRVKTLTLVWIKAHVNTTGNEEADKAAREGTQMSVISLQTRSPWSSIQNKIEEYCYDKWNFRAQRLINLEIPVLVRSLKSSNIELG